MLPKPDVNELNKKLTQIVDLLVAKGFLPPTVDKKALVKSVSAKIMQNPDVMLNTADLGKENTMKGLGFACVAEHTMGNQLDYTLVFKHQSMLNEKDLASTFKSMFDELLKLKLKNLPKQPEPEKIKEMQKTLDQFAMKLAATVFSNTNKREMAFENKPMMDLLTGSLDACNQLRTQFYGTAQAGANPTPVFQMVGNLIAAMDMESDTSKPAFMAQEDNPIGADPNGTKVDNLVAAVSNGNSIIDTPLEKQILDAVSPQGSESHFNPSPLSTKPKPKGLEE